MVITNRPGRAGHALHLKKMARFIDLLAKKIEHPNKRMEALTIYGRYYPTKAPAPKAPVVQMLGPCVNCTLREVCDDDCYITDYNHDRPYGNFRNLEEYIQRLKKDGLL